jgi:hypothetical protein
MVLLLDTNICIYLIRDITAANGHADMETGSNV